jgi:hypothetical protein
VYEVLDINLRLIRLDQILAHPVLGPCSILNRISPILNM